MPHKPHQLTRRLLKEVSRSFYLTLRMLPGKVRQQIGLAYLLARANDTIADTEALPPEERLAALDHLRRRILGQSDVTLDLSRFTADRPGGASRAEFALLSRIEEVVALVDGCAGADQERIRQVISTIASGQELDLRRFGGATVQNIAALRSDDELDDYTYRVAGCVGEFWTKLCREHLFPKALLDERQLLEDAVRFGKGLQLVNILRDLPADLRMGRCYVPGPVLAGQQMKPDDLLNAGNESRFRPLYRRYLELGSAHLAAGWRYTTALPFGQVRLRLACAWPLLIGAATLKQLRSSNVLDSAHRVKVSRREVRTLLVQSVVWYPWPRRWERLFSVIGA